MSTADIAATAAVNKLISMFDSVGSSCAEVFVRVRLWGRSLAGAAVRMQLDASDVRAWLEVADLHFVRRFEEDPKGICKVRNYVYREALRWVTALESQEDVANNWPEFEEWLGQSLQHEEAYRVVQTARTRAALLGQALRVLGVEEESLVVEISQRLQPSSRFLMLAEWWPVILCAACAVCAIVAIGVLRSNIQQDPWSSYSTAMEQRVFGLADGSLLRLDAQTDVRVRFSPDHREIALERGQILCEVRHEPQRTFDVLVNHNVVHALGTRFVVSLKSASEVQTLVTEGTVQVVAAPSAEVIVRSGELASINAERVRVQPLRTIDVDRRLEWTHNRIALDGTLEQAVEAFNRYNRRKLIIDDPRIRSIWVFGSVDAHSPVEFSYSLERLFHIKPTFARASDSGEESIHLISSP